MNIISMHESRVEIDETRQSLVHLTAISSVHRSSRKPKAARKMFMPGPIALACTAALLSGCLGGGSDSTTAPVVTPVVAPAGPTACAVCTANSLNGVVASGAPLANATMRVIDSAGAARTGSADANGAFSINVAGMTAPFIIEATGSVGGQALQYHSMALAADVGINQVNVSALTELMTALVLAAVPTLVLNAATVDLSKITSAAISSAEATVQTLVLPVLQAASAPSVDLRTANFKADGTGLDLALEEILLALVNGNYLLSTSLGTSTTTVVPTETSAPAALTLPANAAALQATAAAAATALQAVMKNLTAQFAGTALPAASAITPFLSGDFLHDGQPSDAYLQTILLQNTGSGASAFNLIGASFDQVKVTQVIDANNVQFQFRTSTALPYRPWSETMFATLSNGTWLLRGDQHQLGAKVYAHAYLDQTPASLAAMLAKGATLNSSGSQPYYTMPVLDASNNFVTTAYLGYPGDSVFGDVGYIGDEATPAGRLLRATYPLYFATPDGQVDLSIGFEIDNNRISANAASVTVTGPGLPSQGVQLSPTPSATPRSTWTFPGASNYVTSEFSDYICLFLDLGLNPIANCGFDWTQVSAGSLYTFVAMDAGGNVLDTVTASLPVMPQQSTAQIYANRAALFAQITPAVSALFAMSNYYQDVDGPFVTGKTVQVAWTPPTGVGAQLSSIGFFQQWRSVTDVSESSTYVTQPLYGLNPAPATASFSVTATSPINWADTQVDAYDAFGNLYSHLVDGNNHR